MMQNNRHKPPFFHCKRSNVLFTGEQINLAIPQIASTFFFFFYNCRSLIFLLTHNAAQNVRAIQICKKNYINQR